MSQDSQIAQTDRALTKRELPRLRFRYGKDERLAFLGHLEVIGTIDRCVRRARLPFSIGNGFARRMRIQFSQALPVGASSCCEYFDVKLTERIDAAEALAMLAAATPPALAPVAAAYVDEPQGALEAWLTRAAWEVEVARPSSPRPSTGCARRGTSPTCAERRRSTSTSRRPSWASPPATPTDPLPLRWTRAPQTPARSGRSCSSRLRLPAWGRARATRCASVGAASGTRVKVVVL